MTKSREIEQAKGEKRANKVDEKQRDRASRGKKTGGVLESEQKEGKGASAHRVDGMQ